MKLGPNQTRWVEALRSGTFEQGHNALNIGRQFCCLGVAAELFKTWDTSIRIDENGRVFYDNNSLFAPGFVVSALALRNSAGGADDPDLWSLSKLNDEGNTFDDIANQIEAYPDQYFEEAV